eukprot:scaffold575_cov242-Pinguiococcus_pyrenoidosus.AAC.13
MPRSPSTPSPRVQAALLRQSCRTASSTATSRRPSCTSARSRTPSCLILARRTADRLSRLHRSLTEPRALFPRHPARPFQPSGFGGTARMARSPSSSPFASLARASQGIVRATPTGLPCRSLPGWLPQAADHTRQRPWPTPPFPLPASASSPGCGSDVDTGQA